MGNQPDGRIPDSELSDEEVQHSHAPFRRTFFSIPEGYWDMTNEQKDAWASEVATTIEQSIA
jgi:hypothetical protein